MGCDLFLHFLRHVLQYLDVFAKFIEYFLLTDKGITVEFHSSGRRLSGSPIIWIGFALRVNLSRILTKLSCLKITGYRIKYSTVLWLPEIQIRRGRKVQTSVRTVNSNSRTSNCQRSLFSKENPIFWIFCISGLLGVPINLDKWSFTVNNDLNEDDFNTETRSRKFKI